MSRRLVATPPAASAGALGPAASSPPPSAPALPPGLEDELAADIELGHQQRRPPSAAPLPPLPNPPPPLARVRVEAEFLDVETGQQQRRAFAVVDWW